MRHHDRGAALLEVIAAILILAVAGLALVDVLTSYTRALATAELRERELADEERLLAAHTLLLRADLDLRLGERDIGPFVVGVQRPEPKLYRIAVGRAAAPSIEDLVTVLHCAEVSGVP